MHLTDYCPGHIPRPNSPAIFRPYSRSHWPYAGQIPVTCRSYTVASANSEGKWMSGSPGSRSSSCCRGVSSTRVGISTRFDVQAMCDTQYLYRSVRRSCSALPGGCAVGQGLAKQNDRTGGHPGNDDLRRVFEIIADLLRQPEIAFVAAGNTAEAAMPGVRRQTAPRRRR